MRYEKFQSLFGVDARARPNVGKQTNLPIGTLSDPGLISAVKTLRRDFSLSNFVETGTYEGETSFFFSGIFEKVFTCDVYDWPKRFHFYFKDNIVYEVLESPKFLTKHMTDIEAGSLFFLDAHWWKNPPLRDELRTIYAKCRDPVVIIDDFDGGQGLDHDACDGMSLDFDYIADYVPQEYKFFLNSRSNMNRGKIFIFPPNVSYGCEIRRRGDYDHQRDSLW